jgi:hypothetical protein
MISLFLKKRKTEDQGQNKDQETKHKGQTSQDEKKDKWQDTTRQREELKLFIFYFLFNAGARALFNCK